MAALSVQAPMFANTGANKEPFRISLPPGPNAAFLERDFLVQAYAPAPPQQNGSGIPAPAVIDATGSTSAGSISSGTYYVTTSYLNGNGETTVGPVQVVVLGSTGQIVVASPPAVGDATGWRLYIGTVLGTYHLHGSTTAIGTGITQTTYSAGGAAPPATNGTGLAAPSTPTLSAGGTTGPNVARTEYVIVTYVTPNGETVGSTEASQALTAGQLLTVTSPGASGDAIGYNVYAATASGQEVKQNGTTPIAIGTNWTEPTTGLVSAGVQRAIANQAGLINGEPAIVGMADHDYNATYGGPVGGKQPGAISDAFGRPNFNQTVFGVTEAYSGISGAGSEPQNEHIISASSNEFEISLVQAWDPGLLGALVGLNIDSGSSFFVADLTQTNLVARIVGTADGPGRGVAGDTYKRIKIKFLSQFVAIS